MTTRRKLHHMSIDQAIRFRDPFVVSKNISPLSKSSVDALEHYGSCWSSRSRHLDFARALTPPPDMNATHHSTQPSYYRSEQRHHHDDLAANRQAYQAPVIPYSTQQPINGNHGTYNGPIETSNRASPGRPAVQDLRAQRRPSHTNAIATNFQIPKSVNDSGGSLSELAAQITCLFWFESSELLQQVEDAAVLLKPTRPLAQDAKPTTGFTKWVTTILSTTMVAQNVVVLALLFIYRLKKLNPTVKGKPGSEYRLLTVALMLGNKFLDDNTYTNKTWAEVSGINVGEVHIMEVEFLSNMKYNLFTSEQDWTQWQSTLGKFAAFFDKATRPMQPAPILQPTASLQLRRPLPSPPASTQASPPHLVEIPQLGPPHIVSAPLGPTPAPSPLGTVFPKIGLPHPGSRKRSIDDPSTEPPPKRIANGVQDYNSPQRYSILSAQTSQTQSQPIPRLTLPSLSIPSFQTTSTGYSQASVNGQQLPPLSVPARAMAMVYPNTSSQGQASHLITSAGSTQNTVPQSRYESRQASPYGGSAQTSPTNSAPQPASVLQPAHHQVSPTYFLQQRSSPYRPVHHVSTLLYPPPSTAMQNRSTAVELNRMHYQPLGQPVQHAGRLPYDRQNVYLRGSQPQDMTPIHAWPNFSSVQQTQQPHMISQQ